MSIWFRLIYASVYLASFTSIVHAQIPDRNDMSWVPQQVILSQRTCVKANYSKLDDKISGASLVANVLTKRCGQFLYDWSEQTRPGRFKLEVMKQFFDRENLEYVLSQRSRQSKAATATTEKTYSSKIGHQFVLSDMEGFIQSSAHSDSASICEQSKKCIIYEKTTSNSGEEVGVSTARRIIWYAIRKKASDLDDCESKISKEQSWMTAYSLNPRDPQSYKGSLVYTNVLKGMTLQDQSSAESSDIIGSMTCSEENKEIIFDMSLSTKEARTIWGIQGLSGKGK